MQNINRFLYSLLFLAFLFSIPISATAREDETDDDSTIREHRTLLSSTTPFIPFPKIDGDRSKSMEKAENKQEKRFDKLDEKRAKFEEKTQRLRDRIHKDKEERLQKFADHMVRRLNAMVVRLEKLAARIESRIAKLEELGSNTEEAQNHVDSAKENIEEAKTEIIKLPGALENILTSELTVDQGLFEELRTLMANIKSLLREAHASLIKAIVSLKSEDNSLKSNSQNNSNTEVVQ